MKKPKILKHWLIVLAVAAILFAVLDFEFLRFTVLDWFGFNPSIKESLSQPGDKTSLNSSSNPAAVSSAPSITNPSTAQKTPPAGKTRPPEISPYVLQIDSLNIRAPIVYVYGISEKDFQAGLLNGVVLYPGTALPGQFGNPYIFGHSSDYIWSRGSYKTIFAPLPKIQIGAEIVISGNAGEKYVYTVLESKKVGAKDTSVLSQQGYKKKLLTLQTSYPVGTALARWVVVAEIK